MSKLIIKRIELREAMEHYGNASSINIHERDDADAYRRYKYAVGRNYDRLRIAENERMTMLQTAAQQVTPGYADYQADCQAVSLRYAKRKEDGTVDYEKGEHGEDLYQFTRDDELKVHEEMNQLTVKHAQAIADRKAQAEFIQAIDQTEIEIELYTFPWEKVPLNLTGGYLAYIRPMLTGAPTDGMDEPKDNIIALTPESETTT